MTAKKAVWIVAAGTGGHIFPGLTLAEKLREQRPELEFLFFGTRNRLEAKLVPAAGFPLQFLKASQWKGQGIAGRFQTLWDLLRGFFQVLTLALRSDRPRCLIGVGGYVSVPVALVAILLRVPFFIIEPNIVAGISNRLLSRFARRAFSVPGSDAFKKFKTEVIDVGNPTRPGLRPIAVKEKVSRLLLFGGSQGAAKLTRAMLQACAKLPLRPQGIEVLIQCGEKNLAEAEKLHEGLGLGPWVRIVPFIDKVVEEIMQTDVAISRAGAMSVAELSLAAVPTIFVPFPFAADDHQSKNAGLLEADGAAFMVKEGADFEARLQASIERLVLAPDNYALRQSLHDRLLTWARPQAADNMARTILSLT